MRYDDVRGIFKWIYYFKRGKQDPKPGQPAPVQSKESANNLLLKKMKIALSLTSEDVLDILDSVGVTVTKGELGALLRKKVIKITKSAAIDTQGISLRD